MTTKERPIIFSDEMVRAILDGRKTQTRRVVKPHADWGDHPHGIDLPAQMDAFAAPDWRHTHCPYGKPGDRLWGREAHAVVPATAYAASHDDGVPLPHRVSPDGHMWAVYRQGWTRCAPGRWRPSIHMPRWASRILLEVTDVRVERVQDLSEQDAQAEGVVPADEPLDVDDAGIVTWAPSHREAFAHLWDSINAKRGYGWASNPWVWVVGFKRVTP